MHFIFFSYFHIHPSFPIASVLIGPFPTLCYVLNTGNTRIGKKSPCLGSGDGKVNKSLQCTMQLAPERQELELQSCT